MIQMIYNSFYSYDDCGLIIKTVNRPLMPTKRRSAIVIPGRDSSYDFSDNTYENIVIPVVIQYINDTFEDLRSRARLIAAWLGQKTFKPLIFTDEPDKYYLAKVYDSASLSKIIELVPGETTTVNFECQPLALSIDADLWAVRLTSEVAEIQNSGTYEAFPIITLAAVTLSGGMDHAIEVTGAFNPANAPATTLTNPALTVGGNTLVYTGTLTSGQSLILNTETFQATKAGANVLDKISGDWPVLAVGNNNVSIVDTTSESGAAVTISFRKRWL